MLFEGLSPPGGLGCELRRPHGMMSKPQGVVRTRIPLVSDTTERDAPTAFLTVEPTGLWPHSVTRGLGEN